MRFLRGFGRFWYDFIVGDDWKIAAAVVAALATGATLAAGGIGAGGRLLAPLVAGGVVVAFVTSLLVDVRQHRRPDEHPEPGRSPE